MMNSKFVPLALCLKRGDSATAATLLEESSAVLTSTSVLGAVGVLAGAFTPLSAGELAVVVPAALSSSLSGVAGSSFSAATALSEKSTS